MEEGSAKEQASDVTQNEAVAVADSSDNIDTSEDEDASSSVTVTSPRVSENPSNLKPELNKPPIGKGNYIMI